MIKIKLNKIYKPTRLAIILALLFFLSVTSYSTHIRAGEITVERVNCQSLTFRFTILGYRDTGSPENIQFGGGDFNFGDGQDPVTIPEDFASIYIDNEVERNVYVIEHTYSAAGTYIISYLEQNRNDGVLNINNSVNTSFYVETKIVIDPFLGCNNSPILLIPPIDEGCTQVAFSHNPGAFDPDGDSLSYEFAIPKQKRDTPVGNYRDPNLAEFYPGDYFKSDETGTKAPSFSINPTTGEVKWDAPGIAGEYNIAFKIIEWRKIGDQWYNMGYVTRDMQIIIKDCDNERPTLVLPDDICVEAGTLINENIIGLDPDGDNVKIEAFSQVFDFLNSPAVINPNPGLNDYVTQPATTQFSWQTDCFHVREEPYQIVFKITDKPPVGAGPKLVTFETWNVTVVGPAPDFTSVVRNGRSADLTWNKYVCSGKNAQKIQVWRRVDSFGYIPDQCETGIRENSGYELIEELAPDAINYTDDDHGNKLAWGAKYCYRLVAVFPEPLGGESIVSREICIDPILADAPVITHVTVDVTSELAGEITVSWRSPFDLDLSSFTLPLQYEVTRSEGFSGIANSVTLPRTFDTTIVDTGINTLEKEYNYRVKLFDNSGTEILTSVQASSVRIEPTPEYRRISLNWFAEVPWSNNIQGLRHEIYRDNINTADPLAMELYDYVNVNQTGFAYIDSGQVNNVPLEDTQEYCYYVKTYGSYGNPLINTPQINFSQIICAQPNDTIAPCTPELFIDELKCRDIGDISGGSDFFFDIVGCEFDTYMNNLHWNISKECGSDVRKYELYFKKTLSDSFELIATVSDTSFLHDNLTSYKGCYKVRAIDRSGNISEFSNEVCKDNCPRYVLPNIFTPNGSGTNDKFYAFSNLSKNDVEYKDCPRFVKGVEFKVVNRWGKLVFEYNSRDATQGGEPLSVQEAILIGWDGKTNSGEELATGVYYYSALVEFDLLDESNDVKTIKGWIQLLR